MSGHLSGSFMPEGGSPLLRHSGQSYLQGNPYDDPLGNHLERGTLFKRGGNSGLQWQLGPLLSSESGDLKGVAPAIFNKN